MKISLALAWATTALSVLAGVAPFEETLLLRPLPDNKLLFTFDFAVELVPHPLSFVQDDQPAVSHYTYFPRTLGPMIETTNTRELHLRFTQGWWDAQSWGELPSKGTKSGGTGVEMWAVIEASDHDSAKKQWFKLAEQLLGLFCASLNTIDDSITTVPRFRPDVTGYVANFTNQLYLFRAALPSEPICTENLTPFLKLLPGRGKAGVSSLLDGHKLYDSLWHSMSIDVATECTEECIFKLDQSISAIVDVTRSIRRAKEGGIPKPTPGPDLRCDPTKAHDIWQCFPLPDPTELSWDLETIFGRQIKGSAFDKTSVIIETDPDHWDVSVLVNENTTQLEKAPRVEYKLSGAAPVSFEFSTSDSNHVISPGHAPLDVSRSLTGYSQDQGGLRVNFFNPTDEPVTFVYSETLPWFVRLYLHTLTTEGQGVIVKRHYKPAIDRQRPSHLEFVITIPAGEFFTMTYQFDKSLLLYAEYPPDANHGFSLEPAVITVIDNENKPVYQLRTTSLLLYLPTPDFSMPYNVIILTCTVMSLAFGSVFNLLTKRVVTEEELEEAARQSKLAILKRHVRAKVASVRALIRR